MVEIETKLSCLIFAGGHPQRMLTEPSSTGNQFVIAADSGFAEAKSRGIHVDLLVGDFDSISDDDLLEAKNAGIEILQFPLDKDFTDLELALLEARKRNVTVAHIVASSGGRLDHFLSSLLLMASIEFKGMRITAEVDNAQIWVLQGSGVCNEVEILGVPGDTLSIMAVNGIATGITTSGLRFGLTDETLQPGSTRGISNELSDNFCTIQLGAGSLVCIAPGPDDQ